MLVCGAHENCHLLMKATDKQSHFHFLKYTSHIILSKMHLLERDTIQFNA